MNRELIAKVFKIINSCKTYEQIPAAEGFTKLVVKQLPEKEKNYYKKVFGLMIETKKEKFS